MTARKKLQSTLSDSDKYDEEGWASVHYAAQDGHFKIINKIIDLNTSLLEIETLDEQATPLWIACSSGHVETVRTLLFHGADIHVTNADGIGIIEITVLLKHNKLIRHFLDSHSKLREFTWHHLSQYLTLDYLQLNENGESLMHSTLDIVLELSKEESYIPLLKTIGIFEKLILLYEHYVMTVSVKIEKSIFGVLFNLINSLSYRAEKREINEVISILPDQLALGDQEIAQVVLSILKLLVNKNKEFFKNTMVQTKKLVFILDFLKQSVIETSMKIEALFIIRKCFQSDNAIQDYFCDNDFLEVILQLLNENESETATIACMKTIRCFSNMNKSIQSHLITADIFKVLVAKMNPKSKRDVKEICKLVHSTTHLNPDFQQYYVSSNAVEKLSQFFNNFLRDEKMHLWIVKALWQMAGDNYRQKSFIVRSLETKHIVSLVTNDSSPILQFHGCEMLRVLIRTNQPLLRTSSETILRKLLNPLSKLLSLSNDFLLSIIQTIKSVCTCRGYRPNKHIEKLMIEKNTVQILYDISTKSQSVDIELEAMLSIAAVTITTAKGKEAIANDEIFRTLNKAIRYAYHKQLHVRTKACQVIALFSLTNGCHEVTMRDFQPSLDYFDNILEAPDVDKQHCSANTAFQLIALRDVISKSSPVHIAMKGIELLRANLNNKNEDVVAIAADFVSGLTHFSPSLRAAFISAGFIQLLCDVIMHQDDDTVKTAVSTTITILARCLSGEILLLKRCRQEEHLVALIETWAEGVNLPTHFKKKWQHFLSLRR